jgi:hypothetical protein
MTSGASRPPNATPSVRIASKPANMRASTVSSVSRASMVKPPTSISALPTPTRPSSTIAAAGSGTTPISASGAPNSAIPTPNHVASPPRRTSPNAKSEPSTPPAPTAALRTPTPGSPVWRRSIAMTTAKTVRHPRVNVCTNPSAVISDSVRSAAMVVKPRRTARPAPPPASARGGASYGSATTTSPPSSDAAEHTAKTAAGPLAASRTAAATGPPRVASESSMPRTAFALVRSCGDFASAGRRAEWAGRYSETATVATTAKPYVTAGGPSLAVTTAAPASIAPRTNPTQIRTCSRRTRSAIVARNGASNAAVAMRTAVTAPTAATPPSRNATTASPTMNALSPAHIAANEIWARRSGPR